MYNPLSSTFNENDTDTALVARIREGDKKALDELLSKHQPFIYNIALKMTGHIEDAEDVTQEILIKVLTNLSQFKGKSQFTTWLYRIVVNYILNFERKAKEACVTGFQQYFDTLDKIPDTTISETEMAESIEEMRIGCTSGMLLCLSREQRAVFVLGEIFDVGHQLGAEIFGITKDNFRQRLSRSRKDLYYWMNAKCGLVNKNNPCRCSKKTSAFIKAGIVDPEHLKFNTSYKKKIYQIASSRQKELADTFNTLNKKVFQEHPFQSSKRSGQIIEHILSNKVVKDVLF